MTLRDLKRRRLAEGTPYQIVQEIFVYPTTLEIAVGVEREIFEELKDACYKPKHPFAGWTECFERDVSDVVLRKLGSKHLL